MQVASVTAEGVNLNRYWAAGTAPIFEIIAALDPFHQRDQWGDLRSQLGPRVTSTVIEDASHSLFPEQAAAVAGAVIGYLRTLTWRGKPNLPGCGRRFRRNRLMDGQRRTKHRRTRTVARGGAHRGRSTRH
jgi:hypothetical protein